MSTDNDYKLIVGSFFRVPRETSMIEEKDNEFTSGALSITKKISSRFDCHSKGKTLVCGGGLGVLIGPFLTLSIQLFPPT